MEALSEDSDRIHEALTFTLPALKDADAVPNIFDISPSLFSNLDIDELIQSRSFHQTKQADSGVRTHIVNKVDTDSGDISQATPSQRQKLLQRLNQIVKEQQDRGVGTGKQRDLRWKKSAIGGGNTANDGLTGNSANAAATATASAKKVFDILKSRILLY